MTLATAIKTIFSLMLMHHAKGQSYEQWLGQNRWGSGLECEAGEALVAVCGSGGNRDCRHNGQEMAHKIRCVNPPSEALSWQNGNDVKTEVPSDWGEWVRCPRDHVATARCSGGANRDCDGKSHWLKCAPISSTAHVRMDPSDTEIHCVDHGVDVVCSEGYVVTGSCGAGSNPDCGTEFCSGQEEVFTGVRCTRIYAYEYNSADGPQEAQPPEFTFDGVCEADTFELEGGSLPVEETHTFKASSSLETFVSESTQQGSSLTTSLNVMHRIGAEVGFPKIGLGFSGSNSIEAGFERETTFDRTQTYTEQLETGQEQTDTVRWEYELTGGLTWTIASWTARVTTAGNYNILYREYSPGRSGYEVVNEDAKILAQTLDERSFTLVLNSENHDPSFLRSSSCTEIATQYMLGIGEFSFLTPDTQVAQFIEAPDGLRGSSGDSVQEAPSAGDSDNSGARTGASFSCALAATISLWAAFL